MRIQRKAGLARHRRLLPVMAIVALCAMAAGPQAAIAQQGLSPTQDQYDPSPEQLTQQVAGGPVADDPAPPSGGGDRVVAGLPFTGLDIGLLAAVAVLLGASGLALRRFAGGTAGR